MMEAPRPHTIRRAKRHLQDDKIKINGRDTCVDGGTQNRDIESTKARLVEAEIIEESSNLDIAYWLEQNRISRRCVWKGEVMNILMGSMSKRH